MEYKAYKVTVRLTGGEKLIFKTTAQNVDEAKKHIKQYIENKGKHIRAIHCAY
ncbi:hypothetical protein [Staphylococcus succinus]|uniref:hypothetical protein n=1 Tax=Staphylococcus succinus TaxID=61015 RepID=UPI0015FE2DB0|nr:hypothetical protein [Staphylococcus succinus]